MADERCRQLGAGPTKGSETLEPLQMKGADNMTTKSVRSSGLGLIMGTVAVVSVLCASPALAKSCTVTGNFMFSLTGGPGGLVLSADGRAAMILPHTCIDPCATFLNGTYETRVFGDDGPCTFALDFRPQPGEIGGRTITMSGVVAFQGLVLMFETSSEPGLGAGLAIRTDMLTGQ
jgi:hypothetical protein